MPKKRNLLRLHWPVGVAGMLVLAWMCLLSAVATGGQPSTALATFNLMATLNLVALGLGVVVVLFALAYGLVSAWGFGIHHNRWIVAQWVLVLGTILAGATIVRSLIAAGIAAASDGGRVAAGSLTVTLMVQVLVLMAVIVIAVRKPGSRRAGTPAESCP
jgi:hypothetical protein